MLGFKIPATVTGNFAKENVTGNIRQSIDDFIELLVTSPCGSLKSDYSFGFIFQNFRFENSDANDQINSKKLYGESVNKNNYAFDLKQTIEQYETRLKNVKVNMSWEPKIKKISLDISGKYEEGYEEKSYSKNISFIIW
jgi:hypothetical protein